MSAPEQRLDRVVGFRIWRLTRGDLSAWAMDYRWQPGANRATCLTRGVRRCATPPGRHCQCGFWGVWSVRRCASRVTTGIEPPWYVMGLVTGWGTVALHGREGFRAEYAAPACLFVDRPWAVPHSGVRRWMSDWWSGRSMRAARAHGGSGEERELWEGLLTAAARYAVPLVPIESAARVGLLAELGVPAPQVEEAVRLVTAGPPPA